MGHDSVLSVLMSGQNCRVVAIMQGGGVLKNLFYHSPQFKTPWYFIIDSVYQASPSQKYKCSHCKVLRRNYCHEIASVYQGKMKSYYLRVERERRNKILYIFLFAQIQCILLNGVSLQHIFPPFYCHHSFVKQYILLICKKFMD